MIRKIICPTDLSSAAQNATAYAAKICQVTGATLELIHWEPVTRMELTFAGKRKTETLLSWSKELEHRAEEVGRLFNISCSADIDTRKQALPDIISERSNEETLVVMGTNGADTSFQQFFGSNAYNVLLAVGDRILIVPEGVSFHTITRVALAWENYLSEWALAKITSFAKDLEAKLLFVHISHHAALVSQDVNNAKRSLLEEEMGGDGEVNFERTTTADIEQGLDEFLTKNIADILIIPMKNGALIRHIFGSIAKEGQLPSCPLLVIKA